MLSVSSPAGQCAAEATRVLERELNRHSWNPLASSLGALWSKHSSALTYTAIPMLTTDCGLSSNALFLSLAP